METIVVNGKTFVIRKCNECSDKCLFHNNNYPRATYYCFMTKCYDFVVIREVNVIDRIKIWFKKKIKK